MSHQRHTSGRRQSLSLPLTCIQQAWWCWLWSASVPTHPQETPFRLCSNPTLARRLALCTCSALLIIHGHCWQSTSYLRLEPLLYIFSMPSIHSSFCSISILTLSTWILLQMVNPSLNVWSIVLSCPISVLVPWWSPLARSATFCCHLSVHRIFGSLWSVVLSRPLFQLIDDTLTLSRCTPHHTS